MLESKIIKTVSMANHLLDCNCKLLKIDRDKDNRNKLIFVFAHDQYLKDCMSSYVQQ
jgi:hypothetical protein